MAGFLKVSCGRRRGIIAALAVCSCLLFTGPALGDGKRYSREIYDEWFTVSIGGARVGMMHQSAGVGMYDGREVLLATQELRTTFLRDGVALQSITITETMSEKGDLRPIGYGQLMVDGADRKNSGGTAMGDRGFLFETKIGGRVNTREMTIEPGTIFSGLVEYRTRQELKEGASFSVPVLMEGDGDVAGAEVHVSTDTKGAQCKGAVFVTKSVIAGLESFEWRDSTGKPLCARVPSLKADFALSTEAKAKGQFTPFDVFEKSRVKPDRRIYSPDKLKSLTIKVEYKGAHPKFPEDALQQVVEADRKSVTVRINRLQDGVPASRPFKDKSLGKYLSPTEYEQSDHPVILAKASEIAWSIEDSVEAARAIMKWVRGHITKPSMRRGYLSALDVLTSGEGDCTEYAVLASAVAKAAGFPTKLVAGVTYADGAFGFHMWLDVWVGYWRPFDPTLDGAEVDPAHIKLWTGIGDAAGLRDASVEVMNLFGDVRVRVLDSEY